MKVSLKWLASYVDLDLPAAEIAERLTLSGTEVSGVSRTGEWEQVVVGRVTEVAPHPNADRLRLATVDTGDGIQTVVCGAPNVATGQKVAFARVGARLIDAHTGKPAVLKPATIRGFKSSGMVCSERELGLSGEHTSILVLPDDAPVGTPLGDYIGDTILDLDVTPNRPDCMSVVGVAREVAALTGAELRDLDPFLAYKETDRPVKSVASVQIIDRDLCSRYCATVVEGVRRGPSPPWMQQRLMAGGMRPINNIVDITNYVMLELGQPLHAFDLSKLAGRKIVVRRAREGERITTIDGAEHELSPQMLAICDAERPVAVAGVMGGAGSEVSGATRSVLVESATFAPASIRRTAAALRTRTEASARFEKGLPPALAEIAVRRATHLFVQLCGGKAAKGIIDVYPGKERDVRVTVTSDRLRRVLGIDLPRARVRGVMTSLGFSCRWVPPDRYVVRVPYWRTDVRIAEDVIEELARVIGYDELPTTSLSGPLPEGRPDELLEFRERLRDRFVAAGMQEIITYSMIGADLIGKVIPAWGLADKPPLRIANPLSAAHEFARTSLRPGLLRALANAASGAELVALFEVGRAYIARADDLPDEVETVCGAVTGRLPDRWGAPSERQADFFLAKGYIEAALQPLGLDLCFSEAEEEGLLHGRTAGIEAGMERVGVIGQVDPRIVARFDLDNDVLLFEIDVAAALRARQRGGPIYSPVSRFPAVEQDVALVVDATLPAGRLQEAIEATPLVERAAVFDVYSGPGVPRGKKSVAFSLTYRAADRTLADEDVARTQRKMIERLAHEFGAELRGS